MARTQPSYTAGPEYRSITEAQEGHLKNSRMKMADVFTEKMNTFFKKVYENTNNGGK